METTPRLGPLHSWHSEHGATMAGFGGWEMPISYADGGVVAEHTATREAVGLFDVSHLGKVRVQGPAAAEFLNTCFTADLGRIGPGGAQYTLCCTEDGGVVDDLIVYLVAPDDVLCVPNAANAAEIAERLSAAAPEGITVVDEHDRTAVLAVQGPRAREVLSALELPEPVDYMSFVDTTFDGAPLRLCRTGYTGEFGFELLYPWAEAAGLWEQLVEASAPLGGRAAGLGARDTLRTEMGYPLHGHEISPDISPLQGGAGWAIGWDKPAFWGHEALRAERERGPARRLRGLKATGRGVPRSEMQVLGADGSVLGETTSGTFSPTLRTGIALALLDRVVAPGDSVSVDVRGRQLGCDVVKLPFVPSHVR